MRVHVFRASRLLRAYKRLGIALILAITTLIVAACAAAPAQTARPSPPPVSTAPPPLFQTSTPPLANPVLAPTDVIRLPTPDPWAGMSRVTVLLLGVDEADWESADRAGPPRTDTMILLTVDPPARTAGVLSVPRDLWVELPGFPEPNKINTAYRFGELYDLPGGGPALAMRTVEKLLGVPINYYVEIDFKSFVRFIDEIQGVKLYIEEPLTLSLIGTDKNVYLEPGWVTLPGEIALAYARSRETEGADFARSDRQRQIIMAVRERILSFDMLPTLVLKSPDLYKTISAGLDTNLTLGQIIRLAWLAVQIPEENLTLAAIGEREVTGAESPDGQDIYVPIDGRIQTLVAEVFAPPGSQMGLSREYLVLAENSRIRIVNQSSRPGLAGKTAQFLERSGLNVIASVESEERRAYSRLVDRVDDPYTLRFLVDLLKVRPSEIYIQLDPFGSADMVILLGEDWAQAGILP